jgi:hypothetical protein
MTDYKLLLWKYILHVGKMEGVTFIYDRKGMMPNYMSESEVEVLLQLDKIKDEEEYMEVEFEGSDCAKDVAYGQVCTFPKYGNNMLCMRVKSDQRDVKVVIKGENKALLRFLDLATGEFHLVKPWELCVLVSAKVVLNKGGVA